MISLKVAFIFTLIELNKNTLGKDADIRAINIQLTFIIIVIELKKKMEETMRMLGRLAKRYS